MTLLAKAGAALALLLEQAAGLDHRCQRIAEARDAVIGAADMIRAPDAAPATSATASHSLLASGEASYITGATIPVTGGTPFL